MLSFSDLGVERLCVCATRSVLRPYSHSRNSLAPLEAVSAASAANEGIKVTFSSVAVDDRSPSFASVVATPLHSLALLRVITPVVSRARFSGASMSTLSTSLADALVSAGLGQSADEFQSIATNKVKHRDGATYFVKEGALDSLD